ncbi:hypothetical protein [Planctomycetes bacterium SV_7m_r]|uniref:hypothetical protein n=1 Tax=Stieleria bergensis TaxID=2528025 RepID=UPI0011A472C4
MATQQGLVQTASAQHGLVQAAVATQQGLVQTASAQHGLVQAAVATQQGLVQTASAQHGFVQAAVATQQGLVQTASAQHGFVQAAVATQQGLVQTASAQHGFVQAAVATQQGLVQTASAQHGFVQAAVATQQGLVQTASAQQGLVHVSESAQQALSHLAVPAADFCLQTPFSQVLGFEQHPGAEQAQSPDLESHLQVPPTQGQSSLLHWSPQQAQVAISASVSGAWALRGWETNDANVANTKKDRYRLLDMEFSRIDFDTLVSQQSKRDSEPPDS